MLKKYLKRTKRKWFIINFVLEDENRLILLPYTTQGVCKVIVPEKPM